MEDVVEKPVVDTPEKKEEFDGGKFSAEEDNPKSGDPAKEIETEEEDKKKEDDKDTPAVSEDDLFRWNDIPEVGGKDEPKKEEEPGKTEEASVDKTVDSSAEPDWK